MDEQKQNSHTKEHRRPEFRIFVRVDFYWTLNVENVKKNINGQNALFIYQSNFIIFFNQISKKLKIDRFRNENVKNVNVFGSKSVNF